MFCSFLSTGLLPLWLDLLLSTLFFLLLYQMGFFSLISASDVSLLVYKSAFEFWIYTLYPSVLPNSLIRLSSFLGESIGFSMYTIMPSATNDSYFLFSNLDVVVFFFLITVAKISKASWIEVVKADILVLFLILVRKILVFAHWCWL